MVRDKVIKWKEALLEIISVNLLSKQVKRI